MMITNKRYWLDQAFKQGGYKFKAIKFTYDEFLDVLSKNSHNLKNDLGVSSATVASFLKRTFPDRGPRDSVVPFLLDKVNKSFCTSCKQVLDKNNFYINNTNKSKLAPWCKVCVSTYNKENPEIMRAVASRYRASKLNRTPKWDQEGIKEFYANCPKGYQVDHIIPLQGENVSGLHVLSNLQYLTEEENMKKNNKYEVV